MSDAFPGFLERVFRDGAALLRDRPRTDCDRDAARALLAREHAARALDIAGPPLAFDALAALRAAELLHWACWCLVRHDEPLTELGKLSVALDALEATPARHFSADLALRFLPQVHRRARALEADGPLPSLLATVLRRWPLSGALADLDPPRDVTFGGHAGLVLLHEERLANSAFNSKVRA